MAPYPYPWQVEQTRASPLNLHHPLYWEHVGPWCLDLKNWLNILHSSLWCFPPWTFFCRSYHHFFHETQYAARITGCWPQILQGPLNPALYFVNRDPRFGNRRDSLKQCRVSLWQSQDWNASLLPPKPVVSPMHHHSPHVHTKKLSTDLNSFWWSNKLRKCCIQ